MPGSPRVCWKSSVAAPRVAAKPRPTESIRTTGASRLRRSSSRISAISAAATGKTILRSWSTAAETSAKIAGVPPTWAVVPAGVCWATAARIGPEARSRASGLCGSTVG